MRYIFTIIVMLFMFCPISVSAENRGSDVAEQVEEDTLTARDWFEKGNKYFLNNAYDKAITAYIRAIALDPNNAIAYDNRGIAFSRIGEPEKAITDWTISIKLDPNYAPVYFRRGLAYQLITEEYDKAIEDYSKVIALDQNYAKAYYNRGVAYKDKRLYEMAIEDFNRVILIDQKYAEAYYNLSCVYSMKRDIQNSIKYLKEAFERGFTDYKDVESNVELDNIRQTKEYEEIIRRIKK